MFARVFEMTIKPEKKPELLKTIRDQVLPTLNGFDGFFDVIYLEAETEPSIMYAITFWHEKVHEQKFHSEGAPKVHKMLDPFMTKPPVLKICKVNELSKRMMTVAA